MRNDYVRALNEGRGADPGAANPYADGESLAMAALWRRGYNRMLIERFYSRPSVQPYLEARRVREARGASAMDSSDRRH